MYSFIICFVILVASYFIYGKFIEKIAGVDETQKTPAFRLKDGMAVLHTWWDCTFLYIENCLLENLFLIVYFINF